MLHGRLITYLDEVARAGSIRKAAARLNVAASAINRQILTLETDLGTPLFQRLPRKLVLTAAGELLIRHVRETIRDFERTRSKIEELKGLRRGEISIALMSGLAGNLVPRALVQFRRNHPRVKLELMLLPTGDAILQAVAAGEADLGFGFDFPAFPSIRILATSVGRLDAVMAPDHPLADRALLRLSDCVTYPLIIAHKSMVIRPYLDAAFGKALLDLEPAVETNSIEVMRQAAMLDRGITFLTPFDIEFERQAGRLISVALRDFQHQTQRLMLVGHDRGSSAMASLLVEMVKGMMQGAG